MATIRAKQARNRLSMPLFDTERQVRNLETAYRVMWQRHQAGLLPESFHVPRAIPGDLS